MHAHSYADTNTEVALLTNKMHCHEIFGKGLVDLLV